MILIVDDDAALVRILRRVLQRAGLRVMAFTEPRVALEQVAAIEPELIVCDIVMPEMNGFEFREEYTRRFPGRATTFAFLSGLGAPDDVIKGLEAGVDEYFVKPIEPAVLVARVRALLRRNRSGVSARFRGDLSRFSLVQILQYCEKHKLSGRVQFETPNGTVAVEFRGGEMVVDDSDDVLAELMDLEEGTFVILSQPVGFDEIAVATKSSHPPLLSEGPGDPGLLGAALPAGTLSTLRLGGLANLPRLLDAALPVGTLGARQVGAPSARPDTESASAPTPVSPPIEPAVAAPGPPASAAQSPVVPTLPQASSAPPPAREEPPVAPRAVPLAVPARPRAAPPAKPPMGRLSGIEAGGRLFQLQTEYEAPPVDEIVTVVILDGRVVKKQTHPRPAGADGDELRGLLEQQHQEVEQAVRAKLQEARAQREADRAAEDIDEERLFDQGLKLWRQGDLAGALRLLERAHRLSPDDVALAACVAAVRRRREKKR